MPKTNTGSEDTENVTENTSEGNEDQDLELDLDADGETEDEGSVAEGTDDPGDADDTDEPDGGKAEASGDVEGDKKPLSRQQRRVLAALEETRLANERAELARREKELLEEKLQRLQPQQQEESPEQEAQRLALMTPEERSDYKLTKAERRHQQQIAAIRFETWETNDKQSYRNLMQSYPLARKYEPEVERRLVDMRKQGLNLSRDVLLTQIIGEKARTKSVEALNRSKKQGQENIRRQQARPANARGDVQTQRGRAGNTPESRLEGVPI